MRGGCRGAAARHCGPGDGGLPLSNTTRQRFGPSSRQIELKRATVLPDGSRTGPVLRASVPEASTSTWSGAQENGASLAVKNPAQPSIDLGLAVQGGGAGEEHRLVGDELGERLGVAIGHGAGERHLRGPDLVARRIGRRRAAPRGRRPRRHRGRGRGSGSSAWRWTRGGSHEIRACRRFRRCIDCEFGANVRRRRSGRPMVFHVLELPGRLEAAGDDDEAVLLVEAAGADVAGEGVEPEAAGGARLGERQQLRADALAVQGRPAHAAAPPIPATRR